MIPMTILIKPIRHIAFLPSSSILIKLTRALTTNYLSLFERNKIIKMSSLASDSKRSKSSDGEEKVPDPNFGFGERKPVDETEFKKFLLEMKNSKKEVTSSLLNYEFDETRSRCTNGIPAKTSGEYRGVSFWMFRDQRLDDNWALICAQKFALQHKCPLYVTFYLMPHYSVAAYRQYHFMLEGLKLLEKQCEKLGIQFHLVLGFAKDKIVDYCEEHEVDLVIADFMPLRGPMHWVEESGKKLKKKNIPLYQVDAHNIVPCWVLSNKVEFGARSLRPKLHGFLKDYLTEIPPLEKHPYQPAQQSPPVDWEQAWSFLKFDDKVRPVSWAAPGTLAGYKMLFEFITQRLKIFDADRNNPLKHALSCMSPYFHFGQVSVQRAILCVSTKPLKSKFAASVDAFVEEAVVRRELADNFCFFNPNYDNYDGAWDWAKKSHEQHRRDRREHVYNEEQLEFAQTHDKAWNGAQIQMMQEGKMHGYMRMYWAKKILEWTVNVEEALRIAIYLNDKYSLDGRDPNGYVGIMWSIMGIHDRGWTERPVMGKIRYMNYNGCARKFDVKLYERIYSKLP